MAELPELFSNNRSWARDRRGRTPGFFRRLAEGQAPPYLWIGCSDSRVPPGEILGLDPGNVFVHRNVANVVDEDDDNAGSVIQFAVEALEVEHVIVCGHYGCGGVQAVLEGSPSGTLNRWLDGVRRVREAHAEEVASLDGDARWRRLCELNALAQARAVHESEPVRRARERGSAPEIHAWIFGLDDGLVGDLGPLPRSAP